MSYILVVIMHLFHQALVNSNEILNIGLLYIPTPSALAHKVMSTAQPLFTFLYWAFQQFPLVYYSSFLKSMLCCLAMSTHQVNIF